MLQHKLYEVFFGSDFVSFAPFKQGAPTEPAESSANRVDVARGNGQELALLKKLERRGEMFLGMFPTPNQRVHLMVTVSVSDVALLKERLDEKVRERMYDAMGGRATKAPTHEEPLGAGTLLPGDEI